MISYEYAAGFMDADGSFGFVKEYGSPRLRMSASQITRPVLEELRTLFGHGQIFERPSGRQSNMNTSKTLYVYQTGGFKIVPNLIALEPFLIVKQDKVREMIKFANERGR
jgi:hypothetical protein